MGGRFKVWYDSAPGLCEVLDTHQPRDRQHCPAAAVLAVTFHTPQSLPVSAYGCPTHARALHAQAEPFQYMEAQLYRLTARN